MTNTTCIDKYIGSNLLGLVCTTALPAKPIWNASMWNRLVFTKLGVHPTLSKVTWRQVNLIVSIACSSVTRAPRKCFKKPFEHPCNCRALIWCQFLTGSNSFCTRCPQMYAGLWLDRRDLTSACSRKNTASGHHGNQKYIISECWCNFYDHLVAINAFPATDSV